MEQHAVPQDITGFKFKLVGDMTLKQFGELAFGAVMAYLFFASNWHPFLKWPLVLFFIVLGIGLAFVPIQERPLDVWIINFFKSIYRPTYYVWKKSDSMSVASPPQVLGKKTTGAVEEKSMPVVVPPVSEAVVSPIPHSGSVTPPVIPPEPKQNEVEKPKEETMVIPPQTPTPVELPKEVNEQEALAPNSNAKPLSIDELMNLRSRVTKPPASLETTDGSANIPIDNALVSSEETVPPPDSEQSKAMTIEELLKLRQETGAAKEEKGAEELSRTETRINELVNKNKEMLMQIDEIRNKMFAMNGQDTSELQKQLEKILKEKSKLAVEITAARDEYTSARVAPLTTPFYQEPVVPPRPARVYEQNDPAPKPQPISFTSLPNIINGQVLNSSGSPLEGVILIVKDKAGNSIRALRTNRMGQFIASTPLLDGEYFLELEKAGYEFDTWQVTLKGKLIDPIEVRAKATVQEETKVN